MYSFPPITPSLEKKDKMKFFFLHNDSFFMSSLLLLTHPCLSPTLRFSINQQSEWPFETPPRLKKKPPISKYGWSLRGLDVGNQRSNVFTTNFEYEG